MSFAAYVEGEEENDCFMVLPRRGGSLKGRLFVVDTIHISCKSDPYRGGCFMYGGIIIYGREGEGDWYTANGTHGKSGYVVIVQTDTEEFKELQKNGRTNREKSTASYTEELSGNHAKR